jgi:hypothetical protein
MMTRRAISLLLSTAALWTASLLGQQPPERERGFKPDSVHHFNGFDSVNLFNGNLNLTIPIATYPVAAGLSYSFFLRYSGNLWMSIEHCGDKLCTDRWFPHNDNAGMGWAR